MNVFGGVTYKYKYKYKYKWIIFIVQVSMNMIHITFGNDKIKKC